MTALVRTELLKLRLTRTTWALLLVALVLATARVAMVLASVGQVGGPAPDSEELALTVLGVTGLGALIVMLLGVTAASGEFHHATLTSALLITPDRRRLIAAKALAVAALGLVTSAALLVIAAGLGVASGQMSAPASGAYVRLLVGLLLTTVCWAFVGVGIGALMRNQTLALALPIVWFLVIETLLPAYGLDAVVPWTPSAVSGTVAGVDIAGALPGWLAAVVLLGYGAAFTVAGTRRLLLADVS